MLIVYSTPEEDRKTEIGGRKEEERMREEEQVSGVELWLRAGCRSEFCWVSIKQFPELYMISASQSQL